VFHSTQLQIAASSELNRQSYFKPPALIWFGLEKNGFDLEHIGAHPLITDLHGNGRHYFYLNRHSECPGKN
jgi:hypothetical protein